MPLQLLMFTGQYTEKGDCLLQKERLLKIRKKILALLVAPWFSKRLAIIHCPVHWKGDDPVTRFNNLAD